MNPNDSTRKAIKQLSLLDYIPGTILIPLAQDQYTLISEEDSDLAEMRWCAKKEPRNLYYAMRGTWDGIKKSSEYLHCVILERIIGRPLKRGEKCDHADGNGLNNTRNNLRLATNAENARNRRARITSKSGFKGVSWHKGNRRWVSAIKTNNGLISLGYFNTPEEAHAAYCEAAVKHFGEFARFE